MTSAEGTAEDDSPQHPLVGHVYDVASRAYPVIQQRESHPVVVLSEISGTDEVYVWPRTSKLDRPGIDHAPDKALGLERKGRFCGRDVTRLTRRVFADPTLSKHRGPLEASVFQRLLDWWLQ